MTKKVKIILIITAILIFVGVVSVALCSYQILYGKNTAFEEPSKEVYITSAMSPQKLVSLLDSMHVINHDKAVIWTAKLLRMKEVKIGKYKIERNMTTISMVRMFRASNQTPVNLTFNNIRTEEQLAERISQKLRLSKEEILVKMQDSNFVKQYGFNTNNIMAMFIPNTYQLYWTVSADDFFKKMFKAYQKFWNTERTQKAQTIGLNPKEIAVLASIVEEENYRTAEQSRIAGLYINRLHKDMLLQSDPTVKYALGNFAATQILFRDLEIDSPYNTYKYKGLPPGPIRIPEASTIDAVLNYEKHAYLYMCAKEDLSGYHNFAENESQHAVNVARYHAAYRQWKINQKNK